MPTPPNQDFSRRNRRTAEERDFREKPCGRNRGVGNHSAAAGRALQRLVSRISPPGNSVGGHLHQCRWISYCFSHLWLGLWILGLSLPPTRAQASAVLLKGSAPPLLLGQSTRGLRHRYKHVKMCITCKCPCLPLGTICYSPI